jgi:plastocyanin
MRFVPGGLVLVAAAVACGQAPNPQPAGKWVTVKGQVVLPADAAIPQRKPLTVGGPDAPACLKNGPILDESAVVDPKTRGIKNVVVWLRPNDPNPKAAFAPNEVHPADANRKPAEVVIDQPCCMFEPRVTVARVGDTIVVKNPAAFAHNFFCVTENNGEHNPNIPANGQFRFPKPLVAEAGAIQYRCTIHPWMDGYIRIFDHPYHAVTDEKGQYEIKNAPAGAYRIVYWHEKVGFKGGRAGRLGDPINIAPGAQGATQLPPTEFPL